MILILCDICYNEFDSNIKAERTPRVLQCGDTFCSKCLKSKRGPEITCMFCGKKTRENVDDLRVNKMIIEKLEEEILNSMKYIDGNIEINKLSNQYSVGLMGETGVPGFRQAYGVLLHIQRLFQRFKRLAELQILQGL